MSDIKEPYIKVITEGTSKGSSTVAMKLKDGYVLIVDKDLNVLNVDNIPGEILVGDDGTILVQDYNAPDIPYASNVVAGLIKVGNGLKINELGVLSVSNVLQLLTDAIQTIQGNVIFNKLPVSNVVPTKENELVNKKYVDELVHQLRTELEV